MAALGPTPEFGESIAHGYFLVSPIRARQAGCLIVRKGHTARGGFPCPEVSAGGVGRGVEGPEGQRGKRMGPLPVVKWGLSWVLEVDPG